MNPPDERAQERVKGVLKAELARRHISYRDLADRLAAIGIRDNERNIANKLSRGTFTAAYFIQCLDAIDCRVLRLREDD
jgi:Domain of unknown function (DUF6471)